MYFNIQTLLHIITTTQIVITLNLIQEPLFNYKGFEITIKVVKTTKIVRALDYIHYLGCQAISFANFLILEIMSVNYPKLAIA